MPAKYTGGRSYGVGKVYPGPMQGDTCSNRTEAVPPGGGRSTKAQREVGGTVVLACPVGRVSGMLVPAGGHVFMLGGR